MSELDRPNGERRRRRELRRLIEPGRIEIVQWGGFQPPWKKGPITIEPSTPSQSQSRPLKRS